MNLDTADKYAAQIAEWLTPYCHRLEIVGSIRRRRPICNDIDLVVIPKLTKVVRPADLFNLETVITNHLRAFLDDYIACDNNGASWLARERVGRAVPCAPPNNPASAFSHIDPDPPSAPKPDAINLLIQLKRCQLDIFCATEATWATLKLCRTGSKEHNIWLAQRAKDRGGHWNPYKGLTLPSREGERQWEGERPREPMLEEADLYAALDLSFIDPVNRELNHLRSLK